MKRFQLLQSDIKSTSTNSSSNMTTSKSSSTPVLALSSDTINTPNPFNTWLIVGSFLGGLVIIMFIIFGCFLKYKYSKKSKKEETNTKNFEIVETGVKFSEFGINQDTVIPEKKRFEVYHRYNPSLPDELMLNVGDIVEVNIFLF